MNSVSEDIEVVGLGQACLDYLGRINGFPQEDGKVELADLNMQCGGPASTALVTLARLGIKTSFLGSISDDPFGVEILKGLKRENVDVTSLEIVPGYTSQLAFIAITKKNGNRTVFWHRGSVPPLEPEDVNLAPFSKSKILHLDGLMVEASIEAARQAKNMGLRVVLDAGTMREGHRDLAAFVDILIASERFAHPLTGPGASREETLSALKELGPEEVVVTLGSEGSIGWNGETFNVQEAFPVEVIDTTGAGDVYHGGYIYGLLQGWDMSACMRFASAVAALKCRKIGARQGIPHLDEIQKFLKDFPPAS